MLREELDRVYMHGGYRDGDVSVVTTVILEGGANLPTVNCMCGEGGLVGGRSVD